MCCNLYLSVGTLEWDEEIGLHDAHLMYIQVQDENSLDQAFLQQHAGRDGHVVDDAETRAIVWEGVVGASSGVAGQLVAQRQPGGQQRPCT